jgi:hypothetical protein
VIHTLVHDNKSRLWCGPAAIALLTGHPTSVIHRMILDGRRGRCERGSFGVQGTTFAEVYSVLRDLGYTQQRCTPPSAGIFKAARLVDCIAFESHLPVLAATEDHWFIVFERKYFDNRHPEGVEMPEEIRSATISGMPYAWRQVGPAKLPAPKPPPASKHRDMIEAKRLGKKYGIAIEHEVDVGAWYVHCPDEVDEVDDIFEGDHYAYGPTEVLDKVSKYVELVKHVRIHGALT